jgi:hypothetical protein
LPAAVLLLTLTTAACGSSSGDSPAVSHVRAACTTLVSLGAQLKGAQKSRPVAGSAISNGLSSAQADATAAAQLDDAAWHAFETDVSQMTTDLQSGHSAPTDLVTRLSNTCQPYTKKAGH